MRSRIVSGALKPLRMHRRIVRLAAAAGPIATATGAVLALALLILGLQGCASSDLYPAGARSTAHEPRGAFVLGVSESAGPCLLRAGSSTARVARCRLVGGGFVCTDEQVRCETVAAPVDTVRR